MSSVSNPTMADIPIAAHTGTRNGMRASRTTIISAVAMRLLHRRRQRMQMRMRRRATGELPVEIDCLGDCDIERTDEQRQHKQRLGPNQNTGLEHPKELECLHRKPGDYRVKRDGDQSCEDIDPTLPRHRHQLHREVDADVYFILGNKRVGEKVDPHCAEDRYLLHPTEAGGEGGTRRDLQAIDCHHQGEESDGHRDDGLAADVEVGAQELVRPALRAIPTNAVHRTPIYLLMSIRIPTSASRAPGVLSGSYRSPQASR